MKERRNEKGNNTNFKRLFWMFSPTKQHGLRSEHIEKRCGQWLGADHVDGGGSGEQGECVLGASWHLRAAWGSNRRWLSHPRSHD